MDIKMFNSMPGPDNILRRTLPNGITVLIHENPYSRTAAINGILPCGAYLESEDKIGLTGFLAGCLITGTQYGDFNQINSLLEESGASLGFHAGPRNIALTGSCLSEDLPMLLGLLKEILDTPVFPELHVEIFRRRILSAFELHLHDPEDMADERFDSLLFGAHPYGRPEYSSVGIINSITRQDLTDFHQRFFGPRNMTLAITGGISAEKAADECEKIFGQWHRPQETVLTDSYFYKIDPPQREVREHVEIPEKSEMALVTGTLGPSRPDPCYTSAVLGNSILGQFGMMGRLGQTIREENGLAYSISSSVDSLMYGGCWSVEAGVNPANIEKTAELIRLELKRFTTEKVTEEELDDVKSSYIGSLPLSLESNSGVASLLQNMETYHLGPDHLIRLPERINAVTPETILETAQKWLDPDKLIWVTAGTKTK